MLDRKGHRYGDGHHRERGLAINQENFFHKPFSEMTMRRKGGQISRRMR